MALPDSTAGPCTAIVRAIRRIPKHSKRRCSRFGQATRRRLLGSGLQCLCFIGKLLSEASPAARCAPDNYAGRYDYHNNLHAGYAQN